MTNKKRFPFIILLLSALSFYTIPLNIYFLASLILFYVVDKKFNVAIAIAAGIAVCLLFYLPIFKLVFNNEYVQAANAFNKQIFPLFMVVMKYFLSARWILLILFVAGIILKKSNRKYYVLLITLLLLPFLFSFIRGEDAPQRAFVYLMPVFCLLLGMGIFHVIHSSRFAKIYLSIIAFYCITVFYFQHRQVEDHLFNDIIAGKRSQELYYNYYLSYYHPNRTVAEFKPRDKIILVNDAEPHDICDYLDKYGVKYVKENTEGPETILRSDGLLDSLIKKKESFYAITRHPTMFKKLIAEKYSEYQMALTGSDISYYNFAYVYPSLVTKDLHH